MILIFLAIHNYGVLRWVLRVNECVLAVGKLQKLVDVETHVPLRNSKIKAAIMPGLARELEKFILGTISDSQTEMAFG